MYFACPNPDHASRLVAANLSQSRASVVAAGRPQEFIKMPRCVIINCNGPKTSMDEIQEHISYHSFPHDPTIKEKWIAATGRKDWFPTKHSTICSLHFENSSFIEGKKLRLLTKTACPTIDVLKLIDNEDENEDTPQQPSLSRKRKLEQDVNELPTSRGKSVTEKKLLLKINNAQEKIYQQNKVIKRLREQNRRKGKKILTLMTLLNSLKQKILINDDQANLLQSPNVTTREFIV